MTPFEIERLGILMEPKPGEATEVEGVLNPAAARGKDGQLYLFPRLVGKGNFSRVGMARVIFDKAGEPVDVERMGIALEPQTDYELHPDGKGGCEDPRVTYVDALGHYVMTYTAWGPQGPRIAIARSDDLMTWERVGLARFRKYKGMDVGGVDDKDAILFPTLIKDPEGIPSITMLHRPLFYGTRPEQIIDAAVQTPQDPMLQVIWTSYWHFDAETRRGKGHEFVALRPLAEPKADWERVKIGGGTPPIECRHGWLLLYHGVHESQASTPAKPDLTYSAGAMVLDREHPHKILYRSPTPILKPELPEEKSGTVNGVVFPTGVDRRDDIGQPDRVDVYYGMADDRIGVGRLTIPASLPK